jgi:transposase InsO family protein
MSACKALMEPSRRLNLCARAWRSDNEGIYTSLDTVIAAEKLNLAPITTPVASPESNGMSEAFVNTLRRDYLDGADRSSAARVLQQIPPENGSGP